MGGSASSVTLPYLFPAFGGWVSDNNYLPPYPPALVFRLAAPRLAPLIVGRALNEHLRAAFAMGMLATKKDDSDLAEALFLEAVLVLDRLPEARRLSAIGLDGVVVPMWRLACVYITPTLRVAVIVYVHVFLFSCFFGFFCIPRCFCFN